MTKEQFIKRFRVLRAWGFTVSDAINRLKNKFDPDLSYGQLLAIARTPTKEEVQKVVKKYNLICPRCGTGEHIVGEVIGEVDDGKVVSLTEYYCANESKDSTVFSKCWYHIPLKRSKREKTCTV